MSFGSPLSQPYALSKEMNGTTITLLGTDILRLYNAGFPELVPRDSKGLLVLVFDLALHSLIN